MKKCLCVVIAFLVGCSHAGAYAYNLGNDWLDPWEISAGAGLGATAEFRATSVFDWGIGYAPATWRIGMLGRENGVYSERRRDACLAPLAWPGIGRIDRKTVAGSLDRRSGPASVTDSNSLTLDRHRGRWTFGAALFAGIGFDFSIDFRELSEALLFGAWDFMDDDRWIVADGRLRPRDPLSAENRIILIRKIVALREDRRKLSARLSEIDSKIARTLAVPAGVPLTLEKKIRTLIAESLYEDALVVAVFQETLAPGDSPDPREKLEILYAMGFKSREIFNMLGM